MARYRVEKLIADDAAWRVVLGETLEMLETAFEEAARSKYRSAPTRPTS